MYLKKINQSVSKVKLTLAVLTALGIGLNNLTYAEAAPQDKAKENINVVVKSNPLKQLLKSNPESKTILTREDLDRKGARNLADALSGEQDIQFNTDDMGRSTISIRGAEPRHTLFLYDGKRLASGLSKFNGATDEIYRLGTDNIDYVEIIRGASSAKYGSDAMGGVVNIVTKIPDKFSIKTNFEVDKLASSRKYQYNDTVTLATGRMGNFKAEATWGINKTAPFLYGDHEDSMQYYGKRYPFSIKAEGDLGHNYGTIRIDHSKLTENLSKETELTNQYKPRKEGGFTNIYAHLLAKEKAQRIDESITWHRDTSKARYKLRYYNTRMDNDTNFMVIQKISQLKEDKSPNGKPFNIPNPYFDTFKTKKNVLEGEMTLMPDDKHTINISANSTKDHGEGTRISVPGQPRNVVTRTYVWPTDNPDAFHEVTTPIDSLPEGMSAASSSATPKYVNSATIKSQSYSVADDYQINDKFLLTSTLRYDVNSKFGNRLSPKVGFTYKQSKSLRYKANIGTGFSTPGIAELYHDWEMYEPSLNEFPPFRAGWFFKGNPDLKPEKSLNFDFSIENEKGKTTTKFTLFRNNFKDFMQIVYAGQMPSPNLTGFTHYDANIRYFDPYDNWGDYYSWEEYKNAIEKEPDVKEKMNIANELAYVRGISPVDDIYTYKNIAKATMQGIELETSHKFSKALTGKIGYTFLDARDTKTNERLEGRGRHLFNLALNYNDVKHQFRVNFWGNYTRNYLDIRDRYETGVLIDNRSGETYNPPSFTFNNPNGDPVVVFEHRRDAESYANQKDGIYTYTKEKKAKEKNYSVWNIMLEKDFGKYNTLYFGVNNLFGAKDEFLNLGGRVYRLGWRSTF